MVFLVCWLCFSLFSHGSIFYLAFLPSLYCISTAFLHSPFLLLEMRGRGWSTYQILLGCLQGFCPFFEHVSTTPFLETISLMSCPCVVLLLLSHWHILFFESQEIAVALATRESSFQRTGSNPSCLYMVFPWTWGHLFPPFSTGSILVPRPGTISSTYEAVYL